MSRRRAAEKRDMLPDPLFGDNELERFTNFLMLNGKKSVARGIVYGALQNVAKQLATRQSSSSVAEGQGSVSGSDAHESSRTRVSRDVVKRIVDGHDSIYNNDLVREFVLERWKSVIERVTPIVEVKSRRIGGTTYQVPVEVKPARQLALAMRWLVQFARKRSEETMVLRLAAEILDVLQGRGGSLKKKDEVHRMAKANRVYSHYRW